MSDEEPEEEPEEKPEEKEPRRRAGETALLATIPQAEPLVGALRHRYDSSADAGIPAHVTVLYPFLPESRVDAGVIGALAEVLGGHEPFEVRFDRCRRFPDALYLAPDPAAPFRALTGSVFGRWPQTPPYAGKFAEVVPHLTVAYTHGYGERPESYDAVEDELKAGLPVIARVTSVSLFVCDENEHWHERRVFRLGRGRR